jgi:hypothetical protein
MKRPLFEVRLLPAIVSPGARIASLAGRAHTSRLGAIRNTAPLWTTVSAIGCYLHHAVLLCVLALCSFGVAWAQSSGSAPPPARLEFVGTVTKIVALNTTLPNWGVTLSVARVVRGAYAEETFTFMVHSPSLAGLEVGHQYAIDATSENGRYAVDQIGDAQEANWRSCWAELDRCWQLR